MEISDLWAEKYRPTKLDDLVLESSNYEFFSTIKETGNLPHLLLVGSPGSGKTTLAKIVVSDILETQYLYLNASDENGIDTIRHQVIGFAQTQSIFKTKKVIILDEADGLSQDGQKALRNSMEEYASIARFILTANYQHKIIEALISRCQTIKFKPPKEGFISRLFEIIKKENVSISDDNLKSIISTTYPDLRSAINSLQRYHSSKNSYSISNSSDIIINKCIEYVKNKDLYKARKYIIENENLFAGDYDILFRALFNALYNKKLNTSDDKNMMCLVTTSEYYYRNNIVIDKEINFYTCLIELSRHIH